MKDLLGFAGSPQPTDYELKIGSYYENRVDSSDF